MLDHVLYPLTFLALLGSGLVAGVFFAFSSFVMRALSKLPAAQGLAAMQSINIVVINPIFLGVFIGTAVLSLMVIGMALIRWNPSVSIWILVGGLLYIVGCFGVTIAFNVPLNDSLATVIPTDPLAEQQWGDYILRWTRWNHVRTVAALLAAGALALALR